MALSMLNYLNTYQMRNQSTKGERTRLEMLKVLLQPNPTILEPTPTVCLREAWL